MQTSQEHVMLNELYLQSKMVQKAFEVMISKQMMPSQSLLLVLKFIEQAVEHLDVANQAMDHSILTRTKPE